MGGKGREDTIIFGVNLRRNFLLFETQRQWSESREDRGSATFLSSIELIVIQPAENTNHGSSTPRRARMLSRESHLARALPQKPTLLILEYDTVDSSYDRERFNRYGGSGTLK